MANSGNTTTSALADSLPAVVASARNTREFKGVMSQLVDRETLEEGTGLSWTEVTLAKLTAQAVTESTVLENYQQFSDTSFSLTPTMIGIATLITDRVARRISKKAYVKLGGLAQNAIQRKKDIDGLTVLDGFSSLAGAGVTLTSGYIAAGKSLITSNTTEPGEPPFRCVLHGYGIKDLYDELVAGIGTYPVGQGPTADVFKRGFTLPVAGVEVYEDGNISIDSSDDAKGGVFAQDAIVLVQGKSPWTRTEDKPGTGGGATVVYVYDEYVYGERLAAGTTSAWGRELYHDATAPSS